MTHFCVIIFPLSVFLSRQTQARPEGDRISGLSVVLGSAFPILMFHVSDEYSVLVSPLSRDYSRNIGKLDGGSIKRGFAHCQSASGNGESSRFIPVFPEIV